MNIAERLKDLRKKARYSQEQVAEILNVSRQAVSKWESAQGYPDIENIIKLAQMYEVSTDYLLLGKEPLTPHTAEADIPETRVSETDPFETEFTDMKLSETKSSETKPSETKLFDAKPSETEFTESKLSETEIFETEISQADISRTENRTKREMSPETKKTIRIIAIIVAIIGASAIFTVFLIAALTLLNQFFG